MIEAPWSSMMLLVPVPVAPRAILVHPHAVRGIRRVHGSFARGRDTQNPEIAKPAQRKAGLHTRRTGNLIHLPTMRFPYLAEIRKPLWRAPMKCAQNQPLPGGLR